MTKELILRLEKEQTRTYVIETPRQLIDELRGPFLDFRRHNTISKSIRNGRITKWLEKNGEPRLAAYLRRFEKGPVGRYVTALEIIYGSMKAKNTNFSAIAGFGAYKEMMRERVVYPDKFRELSAKYGRKYGGGMLLYGPPGCGKTYLATCLAGETSRLFVKKGIQEFMDNDHAAHIFSVLKEIGDAVLFIDEMEILAVNREEEGLTARGLANVLLTALGNREEGSVYFIGSTNAPWVMDPAIIRSGRMDELVYIGVPDYETRLELFKFYSKRLPVADADFERLAEKTKFYSCSDIEEICAEAAGIPYREAANEGKERDISVEDFELALGRMESTAVPWFEQASGLIFGESVRKRFAPMVAEVEAYKRWRR